uniref:1-acyl-sn-glycerol-3-phosphate acyltransferase epsilon n=1 Tax=Panagrellus redivivus TaxID=6233 RepID=A0A7E4WC26_PANRE
MSEPIEITDTLILHCETTEKYDRVIPRIRGSYNRLILHGHTTWQQIKQLWHPGVKQIRINATFEISSSEYVEFINFIKKQCRGIEYTFTIAYEANCPMDLLQKLYKAFRSYKAYEMELSKRFYDVFYGLRIPIHIFLNEFVLYLLVGIVYLVLYFSTDIDKMNTDNKGFLWSAVVITIGVIVTVRISFVPLADVKIGVKDKNFTKTVTQIMGK